MELRRPSGTRGMGRKKKRARVIGFWKSWQVPLTRREDVLTDSLGDRYVTGHDNDAYMYSTKLKHEVLRLLSE